MGITCLFNHILVVEKRLSIPVFRKTVTMFTVRRLPLFGKSWGIMTQIELLGLDIRFNIQKLSQGRILTELLRVVSENIWRIFSHHRGCHLRPVVIPTKLFDLNMDIGILFLKIGSTLAISRKLPRIP